MNIIRKFASTLASIAGLSMAFSPVLASAQEAPPPQYGVTYSAPTPAMTINLVQPAMGLALTPAEAEHLAQDGCLVGPLETTQGLYDWAAKKHVKPCTPEFYSKVDDFAGKESMVTYRVTRTADGYLNCALVKAVNLGNNRQSCVLYPFNSAFNRPGEVGKFADVNWATGGDSMKAQIFGSVLGAAVAGPVTALVSNLTAPKCNNGSCGSPIYNVNSTVANSGSVSSAGAAITTSTPACATCGAVTNPSHTPNGP